MRILGIVGSKRKNGNTSYLVNEALKEAKNNGAETKLIYLCDYYINDCSGCNACQNTLTCVLQDDMQKLYPLLLESQGLIIGSPTYFYNVTASIKAFIDRLYCYEIFDSNDRSCWLGINEILGIKYASVISICEQLDKEDMGFTDLAMIEPLKALGYRIIDNIKVLNVFEAGDVKNNINAVSLSKKTGKKLVKILSLKEEYTLNFKSKLGE